MGFVDKQPVGWRQIDRARPHGASMQRLDRTNLDRHAGPARETGLNDAVVDANGMKLCRSLLGKLAPMSDKYDVLAARDRVADDGSRDDGLTRAGRRD